MRFLVFSRESRVCFRKRHGYAFARVMVVPLEKGKTKHVIFFVLPRESRFCFRERHGCAFARVTAVALGNEKNVFSVFLSLSRESRFCFRERHGCAFARVTAVPLGKRKIKNKIQRERPERDTWRMAESAPSGVDRCEASK